MRYRSSALAAGITIVVLVIGVTAPIASATSKKGATSCTVLKPAQMAKVLDAEVGASNGAGTGGYACSFDIGPGLGDDGGGMVIVTYYDGAIAKGMYKAARASSEKVPGSKAIWDTTGSAAMISKHGKVVAVSVSYTNNTPPAHDLRDEMAELAELAAKKL